MAKLCAYITGMTNCNENDVLAIFNETVRLLGMRNVLILTFDVLWVVVFSLFSSIIIISCVYIVLSIELQIIDKYQYQLFQTSLFLIVSFLVFFILFAIFVRYVLRADIFEVREIRPFVFKTFRGSLVDLSLFFFGILFNTAMIVWSMEYLELEFSMNSAGILILFFHIMGLNILYDVKKKLRLGAG